MTPTALTATLFSIIRWLLGLAALASGVGQLVGIPAFVAEFEVIGWGQWFRYLTGVLLILGGVLMLAPPTIAIGAVLLCAICIGSFAAQLFILHGDVVHTIIPAALLAALAWHYRGQIDGRGYAA